MQTKRSGAIGDIRESCTGRSTPRPFYVPGPVCPQARPSFRGGAAWLNALGESDDVNRFLKVYEVNNETEIQALIGRKETKSTDRIKYYFELLQCSRMPTSVERMMSLDLRMNLADDLLLYTDKITMHHALECRARMLTMILVDFIETLPSSYRLKLGTTKIIHKLFGKPFYPLVSSVEKEERILITYQELVS